MRLAPKSGWQFANHAVDSLLTAWAEAEFDTGWCPRLQMFLRDPHGAPDGHQGRPYRRAGGRTLTSILAGILATSAWIRVCTPDLNRRHIGRRLARSAQASARR